MIYRTKRKTRHKLFVLLAVVNAEEALLSCKTRKSEANAFSHLW